MTYTCVQVCTSLFHLCTYFLIPCSTMTSGAGTYIRLLKHYHLDRVLNFLMWLTFNFIFLYETTEITPLFTLLSKTKYLRPFNCLLFKSYFQHFQSFYSIFPQSQAQFDAGNCTVKSSPSYVFTYFLAVLPADSLGLPNTFTPCIWTA